MLHADGWGGAGLMTDLQGRQTAKEGRAVGLIKRSSWLFSCLW